MYAQSNNIFDNNVVGWIAQEVEIFFPKSIVENDRWGYSNLKELSCDQIYKSMYGCLQLTMCNLEMLRDEFNDYKINHV